MFTNFDELQKASREQMDTAAATAAAFSRGWQDIASEMTDYSKKSVEDSASFVESLLNARTLESAVQIQSDYARRYMEGWANQNSKFGALWQRFMSEVFEPVGRGMSRAQSRAQEAKESHSSKGSSK